MSGIDPWSIFISTGSVLDYLRYKSYENSKDYFVTDENNNNNDNDNNNIGAIN